MRVGDVDHVWFWVTDMERSVRWYADVLGLRLSRRDGDEWAEFEGGGAHVALHGAGPEWKPGGTVVFAVEDVEATRLALEARGVVFDHVGEVDGYARYAMFRDPDGNGLQLIEYLPSSREPA